MLEKTHRYDVFVIVLCSLSLVAPCRAAADLPPKGDPVKIEIGVTPTPSAAGSDAELTVKLTVNPGYKLNKYPKIKVLVPDVDGVLAGGETSAGNAAAPLPDQMESNYFKSIDPLRVKLAIQRSAKPGRREVEGRLSYFYCVAASGFCAPARVPIKIALDVR